MTPGLDRPLRTLEEAKADIAARSSYRADRPAAIYPDAAEVERRKIVARADAAMRDALDGEVSADDDAFLTRRSTLDALAQQQNAERG